MSRHNPIPVSPARTSRPGRRPPSSGGYTDAQGRPELVMHPEILRGSAQFRLLVDEPGDEPAPA